MRPSPQADERQPHGQGGKLLRTPLGWARAQLLYERLKGVLDITPLQERLLLLVQARRDQQRVTEMEILALGLSSEATEKPIKALMERFRRQVFPGSDKEDKSLAQAKQMLINEAKKVYLVRPVQGANALSALAFAQKVGSEEMTRVASHAVHKEAKDRARLQAKLAQLRQKKLPPGAIEME